MKTKVITGIFLGFIFLFSIIFLPFYLLKVLGFALIFLSAKEFFSLRNISKALKILQISLILITLLFIWGLDYLTLPYLSNLILYFFIGLGILWWLAAIVLISIYPLGIRFLDLNLSWFSLGLLIHSSFWASLLVILSFDFGTTSLFMKNIENSRLILLLIVFISVVMDSCAYFCGKLLGVNKLAPSISPNKTLEGLFGAIFVTTGIISLLNAYFGLISFLTCIFIMIIICLFSALGDITESMLKRISGVKDSSKLIPGHGGIFDRIDSHLAVFPIMVLIILMLS